MRLCYGIATLYDVTVCSDAPEVDTAPIHPIYGMELVEPALVLYTQNTMSPTFMPSAWPSVKKLAVLNSVELFDEL
jgi:hypothetical protein